MVRTSLLQLRWAAAVATLSCGFNAALVAQETFHRAAAPAPQPGTIFLYPERIPLEGGTLAEAERGVLFVPVNRADADSAVIGIEVYRFKAKEPTGLPPIFRLHGGPGFQGLEASLERPDYYERVVGMFTEVSDYVVVGQRGIGSSKPNTICDSSGGFGQNIWTRCREYWEARGLDLKGLNVIEAAADVADAARALGYDSIIIVGGSFGSHWGMAVMRYHPELVARAVLSGMEGPNHTYDSPTGVLNALKRLAAAAEDSDELKPLIPEGGIIAALETVRERLGKGPVSVTVPDPETGKEETLRFTVLNVPGWADGYTRGVGSREGAPTWPADILRLYYGDFESVAKVLLERRGSGGGNFQTASYFMLDCGSGITSERLAELKADPAKRLVGDKTWWYQTSCAPWEADLGDEFRQNFDTDIPTVIVHGNWDISTPYENALELAPHFTNGKLVTVVGGSHGALSEAIDLDPEFGDLLVNFLLTGDISVLPDSVVLPPLEWVVPEELKAAAGGAEAKNQSD